MRPLRPLRVPFCLGLLPLLLVGTLLVASSAQAGTASSRYFGMHDGGLRYGTLTPLQVGSVRLWDVGTSWREIETSPGTFDFARLDRAVHAAQSRGARPMIVLGQTPDFHGGSSSSMPNLTAWSRYVGKVAQRYKNAVDYQIWNEPNVPRFWSGSVAQMVSLTKTGSQEIRKYAGKSATVVAPSFPLRLQSQRRWYKAYWSSKIGGVSVASFANVVSINPYPATSGTPETAIGLVRFARSALPTAARRKPMWTTEINYGMVSGGGTATQISESKQASYVARTLVLQAANSVSRVYWYAWNDGLASNTHLSESDGVTPSRAGRAWNVTRGWILGRNVTKCAKTATGPLKGLYTCTVLKGTTEVRRVYWKPAGSEVSISTHKTTRSWSDLDGNTTFRTGSFRLMVGERPIMVSSAK